MSDPKPLPNAGSLDGRESDFERRTYNARHGLADDAEGAHLGGRDRETGELLAPPPDAGEPVPETGPRPAPRPPVRRPRPSAAARAWLDRQGAERRRKSLTVSEPAEAIEVWRQVQRDGAGGGAGLPEDAGERGAMEGPSIQAKIWALVCATPGYVRWRLGEARPALRDAVGPMPDPADEALRRSFLAPEAFEAKVALWPLPRTFRAPLPSLCDAELEELARGRGEIERELEREASGDPEGRLRPGMRKAED